MNKKLKWFCVEPLTGGMYLGAEEAIGHKAEGIISFKDFAGFKYDKEGNVIDAANEQNLVEYLKQKNRLPDWYIINHDPFVADTNYDPGFIKPDGFDFVSDKTSPNYENTDLVVAVPFCSGLSTSSMADADHRAMRNCNMYWIANYILRTISPKIYLFENAPTLMGSPGTEVRAYLEKLGNELGYSVIYYKTNTKYHHNCQNRPRTFIVFVKNRNGKTFIPNFNYEHDNMTVEDFFEEMQKNLTQENDPMINECAQSEHNINKIINVPIAYIEHLYGKNWRELPECQGDILKQTVYNNKDEQQKMLTYIKNICTEAEYNWYVKYFDHINEKTAMGKGYWATICSFFNTHVPPCMHKNMLVVAHYKENRLINMREWLCLMGHPTDMNMIGKPTAYFMKIGQNVPVKTAKFMVSEITRILNNWDNEQSVANDKSVAYFDNTHMRRIY